MRNWSISQQLRFGMGSLSAIILALAVGAMGATMIVRTSFDGYQNAADVASVGNLIAEDLFEAKIAASVYKLDPVETYAEEYQENMAEIDAEIARALDIGTLASGERLMLEELAAHSTDLQRLFEEGRAERLHEADLYTQTLESGTAARAEIEELIKAANRSGNGAQTFDAATAQQGLLLSRLYLERFLLSGNETDYERATAELDMAQQKLAWIGAMAASDDVRSAVENSKVDLDAFAAHSSALHESFVRLEAIYKTFDAMTATMLTEQEAFVDSVVSNQAVLGQSMRGTLSIVLWAMGIGAAISVLFALGMMRKTVRTVTADFDATLDSVGRLSEGDLEVDIQGAERQTELGRIARALLVFRDNGREARRLSAEADAAKEAEAARIKAAEEADRRAQTERQEAERQAAEARKKEVFDALRAAVSGVVASAARGDFSQRVSTSELDTELVGLAEDINLLMANVDRGLAEISQVSARLAEGDLSLGMQGEFEGTFAALQQNIASMIDDLSALMGEIAHEAQSVRSHAGDMTNASEDLARRAEAQAASLEETSAAMTQIAASADSNADSSARTDADASDMREAANAARTVLDATIAAMGDIQSGSKEIEAIVDVIEDIAFQTNLLSLNASVEAARAGEAGKGFAVVANEVRALAQRSAEASSQVQQIIAQSTGAISRGSDSVSETGAALARIIERVDRVSERLREIRSASEEQATAVKDVTNGIAQLDKITQRNAAAAEETRGTSAVLSQQSLRMHDALARLKLAAKDGLGSGSIMSAA